MLEGKRRHRRHHVFRYLSPASRGVERKTKVEQPPMVARMAIRTAADRGTARFPAKSIMCSLCLGLRHTRIGSGSTLVTDLHFSLIPPIAALLCVNRRATASTSIKNIPAHLTTRRRWAVVMSHTRPKFSNSHQASSGHRLFRFITLMFGVRQRRGRLSDCIEEANYAWCST